MKTWPAPKDPQEIKDYQINWRPLLGSDDTLATSSWSVDDDDTLVINSSTNSLTVTNVWLSAGTLGSCHVTNTVTTTGGRTYEQTVKLRIKEK
jgi:hypothetical protein